MDQYGLYRYLVIFFWPSCHTTLFQRSNNVLNVHLTLFERWNNVMCQLGCYTFLLSLVVLPTIMVKMYWQFWVFQRFSKVKQKMATPAYPLYFIRYFNLGGVYWLPGYILRLKHFWAFGSWDILRSLFPFS